MEENIESFRILKFFFIFMEEIIFSLIFKYIFGIQNYFGWKMCISSLLVNLAISLIIFMIYDREIESIIDLIKFLITYKYQVTFILFMILATLSGFLLNAFPRWFCLLWSLIFILFPFFPVYIAGYIQIKYSDKLKKFFEIKLYFFILSCLIIIVSLLYFFLLKEIIFSAFIILWIFLIFPLFEYFFTDSKKLLEVMIGKKYIPNEKDKNNDNDNELKKN